ncbi:ESX-1 secretion system protein EccCb1 [Microbacterium hydrocarbonoxydans]|uniref:ESX-1 secretion system protein EccCb1 n=1 Tax=Microbacterium hydrocarbonoxydans TaxID=273678 RepID=A0A0M2HS19_9MICO|nr:type VII secretion protein EccC [Microbacterium hydrocarbonoxydans]KJL47705.1 ESX-1 secretion system protein EccCb1 [Microbacterium hydrocarbonoxydans]
MTKALFHRPTRVTAPPTPPDPELIPAPPSLEDQGGAMPLQFLLPLIGALSSVIMMVVLRNGQPLFLVLAAVIFVVAVVGGLGFALSSRGRAARKARTRRELYLDYLERLRAELRERGDHDRAAALAVHPAPEGLVEIMRNPARRWERRRTDADHLSARIGLAARPWFALSIATQESPLEPADPILQREAEIVARTLDAVPEMPITADLDDAWVVSVVAERDRGMSAIRSLIAQLATAHTPDDLALAAAYPPEHAGDWAGFDLLPHVQDTALFDGPLPARRVAPDLALLGDVLAGELTARAASATGVQRRGSGEIQRARLVVVIDDHGRAASRLSSPDPHLRLQDLNVTVVHLLADRLHEPDDVDVRITIAENDAIVTHRASSAAPVPVAFIPDDTRSDTLVALARSMAAFRTVHVAARADSGTTDPLDITRLLGITDVADIDPTALWALRSPSAFLRVPFGTDDNGRPVFLDLKESAQEGMGPHGICVGATGSGKSEMLRTLLLSLALVHPPEDLSLLLVDYKGGAAFSPFQSLPHVAGLIDNLAADPQLTTRARASLQGEVLRRQQMLKDADSSPSITHYRELRKTRPDLDPMPHLFMVIDEFGELLTAEPEFIDLFLQIGRIGRSIGIHLLLSSQRIEAGKLRGLDTYLSYRLGLRTFSESESHVVLGTTDAYRLPALPGYGILKVDTSVYQRFRAGFVSGPVPARSAPVTTDGERNRVFRLPLYNGISQDTDDGPVPAPALSAPEMGELFIDEAVTRLRADDRTVTSAWLPPLPERLALGQILGEQDAATDLELPIGLIDDPAHQTQSPWILDLTRGGGHLAIIGSPQSGRGTLLRTIAVSLALTRTPKDVAIYGMDLAGGGLRRLEPFPHVGGVATRSDPARMRRLIEELEAMLTTREQIFKDTGIDSVSQLRSRHAAGQIPQLASAEIVVLVNGYGALRQEFDDLDAAFTAIMMRAANYGVHIVVALSRWSELRIAHQSLFGTKIEMRLNDAGDSQVDRSLARTIRAAAPGRALSDNGLIGQVALPVLEAADEGELGDAVETLGHRVAASWSGPSAAPIRLLPQDLDPDQLPEAVDEPDSVPFGLRQDTMEPAFWEFTRSDQHLLVFGDARSGKSSTLRMIVAGLIERFTPDELAIAIVDSRGHVGETIPDAYLAAHARTTAQTSGLASSIATELSRRPSLDPAALAVAPRVVLIVDDHDIMSAGGIEHLTALAAHLPTARDTRFHIILSRPVAGSVRAMYSPFLQGIRDTGGALLLLSGDRSEGQILPRVHAERFPPGRGRYVRRGESPHVVQVAHMPGRTEQTR